MSTRPLDAVGADLGLGSTDLQPWGPGAAKVSPDAAFRDDALTGRLVLVSAINPTPAGEGKTTCVIGLTQAARRLGVRAACALREPSLGPVFGAKGGGTGGGRRLPGAAHRRHHHDARVTPASTRARHRPHRRRHDRRRAVARSVRYFALSAGIPVPAVPGVPATGAGDRAPGSRTPPSTDAWASPARTGSAPAARVR